MIIHSIPCRIFNDDWLISSRSIAIIIIFMLFTNYCNAQYRSPYKVKNTDQTEELDSLWVLFPDIQSSKKNIIVPAKSILSPSKIKLGDSIMLDSQYKLDIIIINIKWDDSLNCTVLCKLPRRQNTILKLKYHRFGSKWVFEGGTGDDPISCDHLTIQMWDENNIILGFSLSRNCN